MANDYRNRLTLRGERETLEKVFDFIRTKGAFKDGSDRVFDFNRVIPMPEELDIESNSGAEMVVLLYMRKARFMMLPTPRDVKMAIEHYEKWDDDTKARMEKLARQYLANIAKYEYPNWYSFRIDKWGTKWNAYGANVRKGDTLEYETANGYPEPVLIELSKKWPDVEFDLMAADEDIGSNTIKGTFKNGEFDGIRENRTPKAFDIAFELFPECKEEYHQLKDGTWSCIPHNSLLY